MKRRYYIIYILVVLTLAACSHRPTHVQQVDSLPAIYPDYVDVTIPDSIAPLNFSMAADEFSRMDVVVTGQKGGQLRANGEWAKFDVDQWHQLVHQNVGGNLKVTVAAQRRSDGQWLQYRDFDIHVSTDRLQAWGLTYRRVAPGYESYSHMGIYQRALGSFSEETIIDNTSVPGMCVNCHTSHQTNPQRFVFHVRGDHGATMVQLDGQRQWLQASNDQLGGSMVYPYWHPSGRYCAFSTNQTRQAFHVAKEERIEVFDLRSDVFVYNPTTRQIISDSLLSTPDWSENTPTFSPDGRTLYYLTCRQQEYPAHFKDEQYNLCRISFNPDDATFGQQVDTLFDAVSMGKSLTWPRPSYDGRFLLFTLSDYGYFSIWHEESEQWLLDLLTLEAHPLDLLNSPRADSYHNWSLDSRWVVFTSRRDDGLYSRLYLGHIDENGQPTKPFMLPQENPRQYYTTSLYSYNTPDFSLSPVSFDSYEAAREILSDERLSTQVNSDRAGNLK